MFKKKKKIDLKMAENAMSELKKLNIELSKINTDIEEKTNVLNEEYAADLKRIDEETKQHTETLKIYTIENRTELLGDKSSAKLGFGKVGIRKGTPKLVLLDNFDWKKVTEKAVELLPKYVKQKPELDKTALKNEAEKNASIFLPKLKSLGLKVMVEEKFFIDLK